MKIPEPAFLKIDADSEKLIGFLVWLEQFLGQLVYETQHPDPQGELFGNELPKDLLQTIVDAWDEINEQGLFKRAIERQKEVPRSALEMTGLTGAQLSFKTRVFRWVLGLFGGSQSNTLLRRLLKAIDDILDSIASVNPIAHALKEFKDALSSLAHD